MNQKFVDKLHKNKSNSYSIAWVDQKNIQITSNQAQDLIAALQEDGYVDRSMQAACSYFKYTSIIWCITEPKWFSVHTTETGTVITRIVNVKRGQIHSYIYYADDGSRPIESVKAWSILNQAFIDIYGNSINQTFGKRQKRASDLFKALADCCPGPQSYYNSNYVDQFLTDVSKADISSFYPSIMADSAFPVTTMKGMVKTEPVLPDDQYPVVFYPESHRILMLYAGQIIDSGKEMSNIFYAKTAAVQYNCAIKETYCYKFPVAEKSAKEALAKAFKSFYNRKKVAAANSQEYQICKFVMNATIGWFLHYGIFCIYGALKTLALHKINQIACKYNVIGIFTDSIAIQGKFDAADVTKEKELGNFVLEHEGIQMMIHSSKVYQFVDENGKCTTKWSGMPKNDPIRKQLQFGDCRLPLDLLHLKYDTI
jgi:hypothetical protein